mmetsp:Transcript_4797/g.7502  ORF Transcript_4797/g.7502 Transcript_4797/m.7502 type:complete len:204 (-) Transcript_4797:402-1013(-)
MSVRILIWTLDVRNQRKRLPKKPFGHYMSETGGTVEPKGASRPKEPADNDERSLFGAHHRATGSFSGRHLRNYLALALLLRLLLGLNAVLSLLVFRRLQSFPGSRLSDEPGCLLEAERGRHVTQVQALYVEDVLQVRGERGVRADVRTEGVLGQRPKLLVAAHLGMDLLLQLLRRRVQVRRPLVRPRVRGRGRPAVQAPLQHI